MLFNSQLTQFDQKYGSKIENMKNKITQQKQNYKIMRQIDFICFISRYLIMRIFYKIHRAKIYNFMLCEFQELILQRVPGLYYGIAAIGAIFVVYNLFIILRGLFRLAFRRKQNLISIYGQKSWVLVTGSSEGIGKEFALQFAAQGFNIILLARTQSKLKAVKQEIKSQYPNIEVQIVIADLIKEGQKENIKEFLPQLNRFKNISIIVNNAGVTQRCLFTDIESSHLIDLLNLNCFALAAICHKFIPYFEQRMKETGKKCSFINIGSVAGSIPSPLYSLYSASKSYVAQLTNNLSKEYPSINWLLFQPGRVSTALSNFAKGPLVTSTQRCVAGALRDFGHEINTNGALIHKIFSYVLHSIPRAILYPVSYKLIGTKNVEH